MTLYVQAQNDSAFINIDLNEVEISTAKTVKSLEDLPIPVNIITKNEIKIHSASNLNDVMNKISGITLTTTITGKEGLQIQGLDASYISILIDGFPVIGRSFGTLDLNRISLVDIEAIEIVKGSSSSLYGSHALGGVINIISSRKVNNGSSINIALKYATHNTINPKLIYQYKKSDFQISAGADYYKTDGYDLIESDVLNTVNPYTNYTLSSNLRYHVNNEILLKMHARFFLQDQLNTSESNNVFLEGESSIEEYSLGTTLKYIPSNRFFKEVEVYKTNYKTDEFLNGEGGTLYDDNYFNHNMLKGELRAFLKNNIINSILGLGYIDETLDRKDFSSQAEQNLMFIYTQIDAEVFNRYTIVLGSRFDNYTDYSPVISNKLALGVQIDKSLTIEGSIGSGFKTPDFRQRYFDFTNTTIGYTVLGREVAFDNIISMQNEGVIQNIFVPISELEYLLNPETSLNINLGVNYRPTKQLSFKANLFKNQIENLIETRLIANKTNGLPVFSYFNLNQVETKGIECNASYKQVNKSEVNLGYQLLYAFDTDILRRFGQEIFYAKDPQTNESVMISKKDYVGLYNRSRHQINLLYTYHLNKKTNLSTSLRYRSKYGLSDSNGNDFLDTYDEFIDPYTLCDLTISHRFNNKYSIQIGVKNLLDYTNPEYVTNISGRIHFIDFSFKY